MTYQDIDTTLSSQTTKQGLQKTYTSLKQAFVDDVDLLESLEEAYKFIDQSTLQDIADEPSNPALPASSNADHELLGNSASESTSAGSTNADDEEGFVSDVPANNENNEVNSGNAPTIIALIVCDPSSTICNTIYISSTGDADASNQALQVWVKSGWTSTYVHFTCPAEDELCYAPAPTNAAEAKALAHIGGVVQNAAVNTQKALPANIAAYQKHKFTLMCTTKTTKEETTTICEAKAVSPKDTLVFCNKDMPCHDNAKISAFTFMNCDPTKGSCTNKVCAFAEKCVDSQLSFGFGCSMTPGELFCVGEASATDTQGLFFTLSAK